MNTKDKIKQIEEILENDGLCYLCDSCVCPCKDYDELVEELAVLKTQEFFEKFVEGNNFYVTGFQH